MKTIVNNVVKNAEDRLLKAGCMNPKEDALELFLFSQGISRTKYFMTLKEELSEEEIENYYDLVEKRASRVPLQHIIGTQDFMGITLRVNNKVLIPRPETEMMVEQAIKVILSGNIKTENYVYEKEFFESLEQKKKWQVLDLCCGSGAIGIAIAKRCANSKVTASDISPEALGLAEENAEQARVKIKFLKGDLFKPVRKKKFDMIISNPPYIKTMMIPALQIEVKDHEPHEALDGGDDGLEFYRKIIPEAADHLTENGVLMMEIGYNQGADIRNIIESSGRYGKNVIIKDYNRYDRIAVAVLK